MERTALTLAGGRTIEVAGGYESVTAALQPRTLSGDNGLRQFETADGLPLTLSLGAVMLVEPVRATERQPVGFR